MHITFWGTRGSLPTALSATTLQHKIRQALLGSRGLDTTDPQAVDQYIARLPPAIQHTAGGNTPCIELRSAQQTLLLDAGSGLRLLGLELLHQGKANGQLHLDIVITHTHWDHIQGFPFFAPAFIPGNSITFHSPFPDLAERLIQQQHTHFFPVPVSYMRASLAFNTLPVEQWSRIGNLHLYPLRLEHPGGAYGYRILDDRCCIVCATDSEYKRVDATSTAKYRQFFQDADLLIFDAQYSLSEVLDKYDWGHSSSLMGAEFARRANVKRLALFHHDPTSSDEKIWAAKEQAEAYLRQCPPPSSRCEVLVAYDGFQLTV
jgi:phosphoribosyl 1,2-cyclic phosphodiesterase